MEYFLAFSSYAKANGIDLPKILSNKEKYYRYHKIPKAGGGIRMLREPLEPLKSLQTFLAKEIFDKIYTPISCVCAYTKAKSFVDYLKKHTSAEVILSLDIKDFFPSIHPHALSQSMRTTMSSMTTDVFAHYCTLNNSLPQGAPSSPVLSNIYLCRFDHALQNFCDSAIIQKKYQGIKYTRYADDILLSCQEKDKDKQAAFFKNVYTIVKNQLTVEFLLLNEKKTKYININHDKFLISGKFLLYKSGKIALINKYIKSITGQVWQVARKNDPIDEILAGHLSWIKNINIDQYSKVLNTYNEAKERFHGRK